MPILPASVLGASFEPAFPAGGRLSTCSSSVCSRSESGASLGRSDRRRSMGKQSSTRSASVCSGSKSNVSYAHSLGNRATGRRSYAASGYPDSEGSASLARSNGSRKSGGGASLARSSGSRMSEGGTPLARSIESRRSDVNGYSHNKDWMDTEKASLASGQISASQLANGRAVVKKAASKRKGSAASLTSSLASRSTGSGGSSCASSVTESVRTPSQVDSLDLGAEWHSMYI